MTDDTLLWDEFQRSLNDFKTDVEDRLDQSHSLDDLQSIQVLCFGRQKGFLKQQFRLVSALPDVYRAQAGLALNELKNWIEQELERRRSALLQAELNRRLESEKVDVTLPGFHKFRGYVHPISIIQRKIEEIFRSIGYAVAQGPEIESEYHNFTALNFPPEHPARDMQDTFYLPGSWLLRTHTSPVQIRLMLAYPPPIRAIIPGRVFRHDEQDASHASVFHQVEGLVVDQGIRMSDLKGTLNYFLQRLFGPDCRMRFRPSYFPFTEPSAEVDMSCLLCKGQGCSACKQSGWLEILGAGMVHPNVLSGLGIDPEKYTGFAFGLGLERVAMLMFQVPDIRMFLQGDIRFLRQFPQRG